MLTQRCAYGSIRKGGQASRADDSIGYDGESRNIRNKDELCSDCSINSDMCQSRRFLQFPFSFHRWMRRDSETRCSGLRELSGWASLTSWRLGICAHVQGILASLGKLLELVPRVPPLTTAQQFSTCYLSFFLFSISVSTCRLCLIAFGEREKRL